MSGTAASLRGAPADLGTGVELRWKDRFSLRIQSACARLAGVLTVPLIAVVMRSVFGWRIRDHREIRRRFLADLSDCDGPILIAANHLTYYDSAIITWALAPVWWLVLRSSKLPWNVPERSNFARSLPSRVLAYLYKCLPITRGGDRAHATLVLNKLAHLMAHGEPVFMFPEGRRSRTGRIDRSNAAHGVGRLVKSVPGTSVLCVYLRGRRQAEASIYAARGEVFDLRFEWLEPKTERRGLRGSLHLTHQILDQLEKMEREALDGRQ